MTQLQAQPCRRLVSGWIWNEPSTESRRRERALKFCSPLTSSNMANVSMLLSALTQTLVSDNQSRHFFLFWLVSLLLPLLAVFWQYSIVNCLTFFYFSQVWNRLWKQSMTTIPWWRTSLSMTCFLLQSLIKSARPWWPYLLTWKRLGTPSTLFREHCVW